MAKNTSPILIKVNDTGLMTLMIPQMAGHYMVIEQREGQVVLTPFDVESHTLSGTIVRQGDHMLLLGSGEDRMPSA